MKLEILLIINSLLVAVCLYFIQDFHKDFKKMTVTVQSLKEKFTELSTKFNIHIQAIWDRLNGMGQNKKDK